ncbi:MAG: hypothetical protein VX589_05215 [Myxococcota bacterium]|nr:hypothetical protein [Myxococcota bacterium]
MPTRSLPTSRGGICALAALAVVGRVPARRITVMWRPDNWLWERIEFDPVGAECPRKKPLVAAHIHTGATDLCNEGVLAIGPTVESVDVDLNHGDTQDASDGTPMTDASMVADHGRRIG